MLKHVVYKELRDIIGTTKFAVTFGVGALLIVLAFLAGARNYQASMARYEAARAETLRKLEGITDWLSVRDHRIFLPPQPLVMVFSGLAVGCKYTSGIMALAMVGVMRVASVRVLEGGDDRALRLWRPDPAGAYPGHAAPDCRHVFHGKMTNGQDPCSG